ncbi:MAG: NADH-quinone oxidoreductase subunit C [Acidobacteria bacterium]|nr:NADH-quinone oxidoreductase subunit C [Acidobacteriota bacterium]
MPDEKQPEQPTSGTAPAGPSQPAAAKPGAGAKPEAEAKEAAKAAPPKAAGPAPTPWESELVTAIRGAFPGIAIEALTYLHQNFLILPSESILPIALYLKSECKFDMLTDLTAVDYPRREKRFEVIYQLYSFPRNEQLRLKAPLAEDESIESVVAVWAAADWLEREAFDMFGIRFANHPNLKRILLPDEWEGHPLRKDYSIIQQDVKWVRENLHIESGQ